jgi:hypothetical protein
MSNYLQNFKPFSIYFDLSNKLEGKTMKITTTTNTDLLVRRALFLAWKASRVVGMGAFQDRGPEQTEDDVWKAAFNNEDYPGGNLFNKNKTGKIYADYVMGRMMKIGFEWKEGEVSCNNDLWKRDYQSFCRTYPNFQTLIESAEKSLSLNEPNTDEKE